MRSGTITGFVRTVSRFVADQGGGLATLAAWCMIPMIAIGAVAVDMSNAYVIKRQLQSAADTAVLAAATALPNETAARSLAIHYATELMDPASHGEVLTSSDVEFGRWDADMRTFTSGGDPTNAVRVSVRRSDTNGNAAPVFLAFVLGEDGIDVSASAVAANNAALCMLILEPYDNGIYANSDAHLDAIDCSIHVNSVGANAMVTNSLSTIEGESCVGGNYQGGGYSPTPVTGCDPLDDPLASLQPPSDFICDYYDLVVNGTSTTLYPGVYCGKLEINSGGYAHFAPGVYVIRDANFTVNSGSSITGDNVFFYFTGQDSVVKFNSDATVQLSALSSGYYAGVIFFQDRNVTWPSVHELNSDADSSIDGIMYFPNGRLKVNSHSASGASECSMLIARQLELNSDVDMTVRHGPDCVTPAAFGTSFGIALVD